MDQAELIERARCGDDLAFARLIRRWEDPVYNVVHRTIGNASDAEELTQATFVRAYEKLHKLKSAENFHSWLFSIAVNLCRDEHRRRKKWPVHMMAADEEASLNGEALKQLQQITQSTPVEELQRHQLSELLEKALQMLPQEQREAVVLKELLDMKIREVAEATGVPVNTAKTRLYTGLRNLHRIFVKINLDLESLIYEL